MSTYYKDYKKDGCDCYDKKKDCGCGSDCKPKHPCPKPVILECGNGGGVTLPLDVRNGKFEHPRTVATVTIDTTCLCKPIVKLDFSAIIAFREKNGSDLRITFQLSRLCDNNSHKIPLQTWNFERDFDIRYYGGYGASAEAPVKSNEADGRGGYYHEVDAETVDSFSFTFCECNTCPACCTYIVEIIDLETNNVDTANINNAFITALAVSC